jgi:hypothetical protein
MVQDANIRTSVSVTLPTFSVFILCPTIIAFVECYVGIRDYPSLVEGSSADTVWEAMNGGVECVGNVVVAV